MPTFIDKELKFFSGDEASKKLSEVNDQKFLTESGIIAVDTQRWIDAQYYERKTWMEVNRGSYQDHNEKNKDDLGGYSYLSGKTFNKAIEVGCGPFTNLRCILPLISVSEIFLLDPLIETYLDHPNCKYKDRCLMGKPVTLLNSSIEDFNISQKFDLVVMINVLIHCKDANKVLDTLWNILSPGGTLVFQEPCFKMDTVKEHYDAGHPLALTYDFLNGFLSQFEKTYRLDIPRKDRSIEQYICFSGTKLGTPI
jgi:SAM-dependent methyltransferase